MIDGEEGERLINLYKGKYSGYGFCNFIVQDLPSGHNWVELEEAMHVCTKCSQKIVLLRSLNLNDGTDAYSLGWFLTGIGSDAVPCFKAVMRKALL